MTKILSGKEVSLSVKERCQNLAQNLNMKGINPCLAIVRVGEKADDLYYQSALEKTCQIVGLECKVFATPGNAGQNQLENILKEVSGDSAIHGILLFSPLPKDYDEKAARDLIAPKKDVDCLTMTNAAAVFTDASEGFAPCTPAAVIEMLHYYQIPIEGKRVVIIGRSLVVGKPLAMLLLKENATVTICHSRTKDLNKISQEADILIAAIGRAKMINQDYVRSGQIVIDVGINPDPLNPNKICGDLDYDTVEPIVKAITPVPGGVGSVTSSILCLHTLQAAEEATRHE